MERLRVAYDREDDWVSERDFGPVSGAGLCEAERIDAAMMPSGYGSETMPELERVMQLSYLHGYRVGLQVGEHGRVILHVRDVTEDRRVIAVLGETIEECARRLFGEILKRGYVPRHDLSTSGG